MVYNEKKYKWRKSHPVNAQEAGEYIEGLEREKGAVTCGLLVDESRPQEAVLHPCFEWDDYKAAEKYRRHQACGLLGDLITVEVTEDKESPTLEVQAFVNVTIKPSNAIYKSISKTTEDEMKIVIINALNELLAFRKKYARLEKYVDFKNAFSSIDKLNDKYKNDI